MSLPSAKLNKIRMEALWFSRIGHIFILLAFVHIIKLILFIVNEGKTTKFSVWSIKIRITSYLT